VASGHQPETRSNAVVVTWLYPQRACSTPRQAKSTSLLISQTHRGSTLIGVRNRVATAVHKISSRSPFPTSVSRSTSALPCTTRKHASAPRSPLDSASIDIDQRPDTSRAAR
jgi:hypothetical protein